MALTETEPTAGDESATRYDFDASLAEKVTLEGDNTGDAFLALPGYSWDPGTRRICRGVRLTSLEEDLTLAGPASADLWIRSSTEEADIGVTLSEVRPDGKETYIQSGVLRGTMRKAGPEATELWPAQTDYAEGRGADARRRVHRGSCRDLPVRTCAAQGFTHSALGTHPGGDRARWSYILSEGQDGATFDVGHLCRNTLETRASPHDRIDRGAIRPSTHRALACGVSPAVSTSSTPTPSRPDLIDQTW